jgi:hypothetical protein
VECHYIGSRHDFMELAGMLWAIPSSFSFLAFPNRLDLIACGMIRDRGLSGGGELRENPRVVGRLFFNRLHGECLAALLRNPTLLETDNSFLVPEPIPSAPHRVKLMVNFEIRVRFKPNSESCNEMN